MRTGSTRWFNPSPEVDFTGNLDSPALLTAAGTSARREAYMGQVTKLLLVYNADVNFIARVGDFLTKVLRPLNYPCHLCMLTFGWFSMLPAWRSCLEQRPEEVVELHRDEFHEHFGTEWALPAIFLQSEGELLSVLSAEEVNGIATLGELMEQVTERLN